MELSSATSSQSAIRAVATAAVQSGAAPVSDLAARSDPATIELFEQAVRLHTRRLLAIARAIAGNRASAEDVVQQALTNLFQHRARYDWGNPGQPGSSPRRPIR
jgi:hypothetical protein